MILLGVTSCNVAPPYAWDSLFAWGSLHAGDSFHEWDSMYYGVHTALSSRMVFFSYMGLHTCCNTVIYQITRLSDTCTAITIGFVVTTILRVHGSLLRLPALAQLPQLPQLQTPKFVVSTGCCRYFDAVRSFVRLFVRSFVCVTTTQNFHHDNVTSTTQRRRR